MSVTPPVIRSSRRAAPMLRAGLLALLLTRSGGAAEDKDLAERRLDVAGTAAQAWGPRRCDGLMAGLRTEVPRLAAGEPLRHWLALWNRSSQTRKVTLYYDLSVDDRTSLVARSEVTGVVMRRPAVLPLFSSTGGYRIVMELGPGEAREYLGAPVVLDSRFAGWTQLRFELGGTKSLPCKVQSGLVRIQIER